MAFSSKLSEYIKNDKIGVIPTDTIYGVVASALSKKTVARAYKLLKRNPRKPFIILISSIKDLKNFNIKLDKNTENVLKRIWPGKVSAVLKCTHKKFDYLHRDTKTLAFRVPKKPSLTKILKKTGPLVSTSANPEEKKPAETMAEAKKYFGNKVDFYINGGRIKSRPSTLIEIKNGKINVLRKGVGLIPKHVT